MNEDVPLDTSGSASEGTGASGTGAFVPSSESEASDTPESGSDSGNGDSANTPAPGSSSATTKYTGSANGQTSADVALNGEATVGTIEYNGLAYTINADAPDTVAVTGLATDAPKGDMTIPSQIASGDKLYTVTKIVSWGGGFSAKHCKRR